MADPSPEDLERVVDQAQQEDMEARSKQKQQNPLGEEHLRKQIPKDISGQKAREEDPDRAKMLESYNRMKNNGGSEEFDEGKQTGAIWRNRQIRKARAYLARGAEYRWVLWKLKRDTGLITETARRILDDAMEDEPEREPKGAPKGENPRSQ